MSVIHAFLANFVRDAMACKDWIINHVKRLHFSSHLELIHFYKMLAWRWNHRL
jgi:hypothetical protein